MKIGVVADTHSVDLPKQMWQDFENAEMVIHAGDFCSVKEFKQFRKCKNFKAVYGNMDEPELVKKLPESDIFEIANVRIGLWHGCGASSQVLERVREKFKDNNCDVVIFGHSHQPFNETIDKVLYFNPGSPNDNIFAPYLSYGILEIDDGRVKGRIIKVNDNG